MRFPFDVTDQTNVEMVKCDNGSGSGSGSGDGRVIVAVMINV